ncbi:MAG: gephyrin-like molybdotransferase Glp [Pseudomonadota bacterium]
MRSVKQALADILASTPIIDTEIITLYQALGRILSDDTFALLTHPEHDISAMDGYAVRKDDVGTLPCRLEVIEEIPAGTLPVKALNAGQASRIFTGAALPPGANQVVLQEDVDVTGKGEIRVRGVEAKSHVRLRGLDFQKGGLCRKKGTMLAPADIGLLAAANVAEVAVYRRPRVAILSTGSELVRPGETPGPGQIVSSNGVMISALVAQSGGIPLDIGPVPDDEAAMIDAAAAFDAADICVTIGGASVGKYDLVQSVLSTQGLNVGFWKIAMRPGKPLIFGDFKGAPFFGLPGNPVSAFVCALLFLKPALQQMGGRSPSALVAEHTLKTLQPLPANGKRETYLRAAQSIEKPGWVDILPIQDSAMLSALAAANCLVVRPADAAVAQVGDGVSVLSIK